MRTDPQSKEGASKPVRRVSKIIGYLYKKSSLGISWNARWCEFNGKTFTYANEEGSKIKREIKIERLVVENNEHQNCFSIFDEDENKFITFKCSSSVYSNHWIYVLNSSLKSDELEDPTDALIQNKESLNPTFNLSWTLLSVS